MPYLMTCGLCPLTIRVHLTGTLSCWWCPACGCFNTTPPEAPSG